MKQKWIVALLCAMCLLALAGCGCEHVWREATCTEAPTCEACGKTQPDSQPLGHNWLDADCMYPEICTRCAQTQGELGEHDWQEVTCAAPKTCTVCGLTEGDALPHTWKDATCTNPQTCTVCGATEGEALGHTWQAADCGNPQTCTVCGTKDGKPAEHTYEKNVCTMCGDKMIEDYNELIRYLNKTYPTIHTAIGDVKDISFEIEVHESLLFEECDFELQIMSTLFCKDLQYTLSYIIKYGNMLPYEDRVQAAVDVLDFEMEIARLVEDVFPGKKFSVYFYDWGYEYPSIKVGFVSTKYLPFFNYKDNNSGINGYGSTDLCDWYMSEYDLMTDAWLHEGYFSDEADALYDAIIEKSGYDLTFSYHSKLFRD